MPSRRHLLPFSEVADRVEVRRAVVLMGPRRVGKTVLLHQYIQQLIDAGHDPSRIAYLSVEHPIYNALGLDDLFAACREAAGGRSPAGFKLFLDEIQYCREWERHLKVLVDSYPDTRFFVSGSAAAALRLKSIESGAGRFTDYLLPPLTFGEFLRLTQRAALVESPSREPWDEYVALLNDAFIEYINFGGYPELALLPTVRSDPARYIKSDIIDKVLLNDLPALYGVSDIQELNSLFTSLAYNTGNEVSLQSLSQKSGVSKNTLKRYIEYLEAAFLIRVLHRIDFGGKRFRRANYFKIYLTNPSMWRALFSPVGPDDEATPALVETAVLSQWFACNRQLFYVRDAHGEIDLYAAPQSEEDAWLTEVKWSDRDPEDPAVTGSLIRFARKRQLSPVLLTTRTRFAHIERDGVALGCIPSSYYCMLFGDHFGSGAADLRRRLIEDLGDYTPK